MSYQVLARKWRPQDFSALVGQDAIVTALRNALREGRIAQAYLFSGIRGVGKTTTARVLAKALNCENGPAEDPCNECRSCTEITTGADLDVIEVDAATYSKVEQVRELTESLRYGPARDRYKVVVIDEIHRLSRQAFDALLKIVEEPPSHLTFVFATTEIDAVPATILSRCQEFHFRRVPAETLAAHLAHLAEEEEIQASDTALRLIARAGDGSVRDSVALLDQLATFGNGTIEDEDAVRLLGGLDTALFAEVLEHILAGEALQVSQAVRRIEDEGWDPRSVYSQFLRFCRDALHLGQGADPSLVDLPQDQTRALGEQARAIGYENLLRLLNQLLQSEELVRTSDAGALALEIAWLRAAELPKLVRIEEMLAGAPSAGGSSEPSPSGGGGRRDSAGSGSRSAAPPERRGAPQRDATPPRHVADAPPGPSSTSPQGPATVDELRQRVGARSQSLGAHLDSASEVEVEGDRVSIVLEADDRLTRDAFGRERNRKILDEVVQELWGSSAQWATRVLRGESRSSRPEPRPEPVAEVPEPLPEEHPSASHPTVQKVLDVFGGSVSSVEARPRIDATDDAEGSPSGPSDEAPAPGPDA